MKPNLLIAVIGHRNSGKSQTWYHLFDETVKTGYYERDLYFNKEEYTRVFLINGSPEERGLYVGDIIGDQRPRIVLCSMQYIEEVKGTLDYFVERDYHIFCHWLNPGYNDQNNVPQYDDLGLMNRILALGDSNVSIKNGRANPWHRMNEIEIFLLGWAKYHNLLFRV